jgi:iron complex transport system permease protein
MTGSKPDGRRLLTLVLLALLALAVLAAAPLIGPRLLGLAAIRRAAGAEMEANIFWDLRLPRVLVAAIAGAGLAAAGMAFQAMFRNPLATPYTLGVSAGASLGAAVYFSLGLSVSVLGVSGASLMALAGAGLSIGLVYGLTRAARGLSTATLLLAGIAVNFFFSSLILFMQYLADFTQSFRIVRWLMGELTVVGLEPVFNLLPFVVSGTAIIVYLVPELDLLMLGDDIASSRGVNVERTRTALFLAASLMVGGVVAVCGPIGFVGIMVPHICRLLIGADHRHLAPASILFGAAFLVICDTLARTVIAPAEMPVGVITALLGGPFFLWLLLRSAGRREL